MKRITVIASGRIQDVGYRARVVAIAKEFGLKGNIQNLVDGRVRITAEGEEGDLKEFLDAIRIKNTLIDVEDVDVEYSGATGEYANFYKLVEGGETDGKLDKASEYLKELIVAVKGGFENLGSENLGSKMDMMIDKQDMMIDKQDQTIDEMRTGFGDMKDEMRTGFGDMKDEMRTGFGDMKDEMRTGFESLSSKQDQTIDEIRALRGDLKSYIEWRTEKLKSELKEEIRTEFDERIRALKAHELCADVTG
jgi:acylphosphatase